MTDEIKPDEDIDVMHDVDRLRIERMSGESLWFAGYRDDGTELHFNALCDGDGGLTIHTWHYNSEQSSTPTYELGDRLIHTIEEEWAEPEDDFPYEKVVKQRFWDVDEREYWYAIGLPSVAESYEMYAESYLEGHYRKATEGEDDRV